MRIPCKLPGQAGGVRTLLQPAALQSRAHPPHETRPQRLARASILVPKRLKLPRSRKAHVHRLHFVHHPEGVLVQQPELHGPARPGARVAAVHRARKQHVLGSDQHRVGFGIQMPPAGVGAAHDRVHADLAVMGALTVPQPPDTPERRPNLVLGLFHQHPHRQAPDQAARPIFVPQAHPMPSPSREHAEGLAKSRGRTDQAIPAGGRAGHLGLPSARIPAIAQLDKEAMEGRSCRSGFRQPRRLPEASAARPHRPGAARLRSAGRRWPPLGARRRRPRTPPCFPCRSCEGDLPSS